MFIMEMFICRCSFIFSCSSPKLASKTGAKICDGGIYVERSCFNAKSTAALQKFATVVVLTAANLVSSCIWAFKTAAKPFPQTR